MQKKEYIEIIKLPTFNDDRGGLTFIETASNNLPFEIKDVYVLSSIADFEKTKQNSESKAYVVLYGSVRFAINNEPVIVEPKTEAIIVNTNNIRIDLPLADPFLIICLLF